MAGCVPRPRRFQSLRRHAKSASAVMDSALGGLLGADFPVPAAATLDLLNATSLCISVALGEARNVFLHTEFEHLRPG